MKSNSESSPKLTKQSSPELTKLNSHELTKLNSHEVTTTLNSPTLQKLNSPKLIKQINLIIDDVSWVKELKDMSILAVQVSLATVCRIVLGSIDSAFLGHIGMKELAASSLASTWTNPPLNGVWAGASALVTLCGQAWGAKNYELTGIWFQLGLVITSTLMIPVFIWYWCVGFILPYTSPDEEVVRLGGAFARILSFSIWPALTYACLRTYFQAMGIMLPTTIVGICAIGVAIGSNSVLVYGCWGWKGLGFYGSPLATVIATWFQLIALTCYGIWYKKFHLQAWKGWDRKAWTVSRLKVFFANAGPIASNSFVSNLATSLISLVAAKMGSDVIAANAVFSSLWGIIWALFWGYGCATQIRVANFLGAGMPNSAKKSGLMGFACTIVCLTFLGSSVFALNENLFRIYTNEERLVKLCMTALPFFVLGFMMESTEILVGSVLTAMSKVRVIFWTSSFGTWFINLPCTYLLGLYLDLGLPALSMSLAIMEAFKLSIFVYALKGTDWQLMSKQAMGASEVKVE